MPVRNAHHTRRRAIALILLFAAIVTFSWHGHGEAQQASQPFRIAKRRLVNVQLQSDGGFEWAHEVIKGDTFEVSVSIPQPSDLPPNGRIQVRWRLLLPNSDKWQHKYDSPSSLLPPVTGRARDAFGIYTPPTTDWTKTLHALDPDVYVAYRAPVSGTYILEIAPSTDNRVFEGPRWREDGIAPQAVPFPRIAPWPKGKSIAMTLALNPLKVDSADALANRMQIELEPNDTPELAQEIRLPEGDGIQAMRITGGADDIEYFDNGQVGKSGDDWFRLNFTGKEPRLLTGTLMIPDHTLAAQLRFYALDRTGSLVEYTEGRNENERTHQQNEQHRSAISRLIKPGGTYFLRAEANAPGYEIELRVLKPAPYDDPRMAIRQAMYDHLGQVDAWLTNRPRGASVERRIRDTGNLMGTHCMSCHTQSGVWGPAVAIENGYRAENIQSFRRLINVMYESLRPTNYLKDAANNTSLAPLDVGDGPAGTRVAGHNVCTAERVAPARKLHSMQAIRAANHTLQTADPSGINAAGPGSNVGQSVVYNYAGEILRVAWDRTHHPRYFAGLEEKAEKLLAVNPRYSDDLSHRIEFFRRFFPRDYLSQNESARSLQRTVPPEPPEPPPAKPSTDGKPVEPPPARFPKYQLKDAAEAAKLWNRIQEQLAKDEARLRAIQNPDGSWGFDPGKGTDGQTWKTNGESDPAPTALALIALQALGHDANDPAVKRGVTALLRVQDPYGRWNKNALTGFVTTAYALHALSRLYPELPRAKESPRVDPKQGTLVAEIAKARELSHIDASSRLNEIIAYTWHSSPQIRFWGAMALGARPSERGVPPLVRLMGDPVKMVRDAAAWAMEQTLLDDVGFSAVFRAYETGSDLTRESILKSLGIRADAVLTSPRFDKRSLESILDRALNRDPHPGVRAWAAKAAWQWWVWNPPMRPSIQVAWERKLLNTESSVLVENCFRYQSHALFITNGHRANGSDEHQYKELANLFRSLERRLDDPSLSDSTKDLLARRLVAVAATFYSASGGDGGPGQMGYITDGSAEMMGKATMRLWNNTRAADIAELRLMLEGAANVAYQPLQDRIINYSTNGPEQLRTLAAAAVSDPSAVTLPGVQEKVEPLVEQILRGAMDYDRRQTLAQPVLRLFARARWAVPSTTEQREILYRLLIPKFNQQPSDEDMKRILEAAAAAVRPMGLPDADWYVADRMGSMLAANSDLHTDVLLRFIPGATRNPLIAHFWLPSVSWVATYGDPLPDVEASTETSARQAGSPEIAAARSRSIELYLQMLRPETPVMSRNIALRLASQTAIRRDARVQEAFRKLVQDEKSEAARNALYGTDEQAWLNDLREAVRKEPLAGNVQNLRTADGTANLTPQFLASFRYFNDYVVPELNRNQRQDEMSCLKCHGVPGRVPSMELSAIDGVGPGQLSKVLRNYLILQQRVNVNDIESSKLLRKPLNIQTGKEDGHQGGRRYVPADRGYQIIRRWVLDQTRVAQGFAAHAGTR